MYMGLRLTFFRLCLERTKRMVYYSKKIEGFLVFIFVLKYFYIFEVFVFALCIYILINLQFYLFSIQINHE